MPPHTRMPPQVLPALDPAWIPESEGENDSDSPFSPFASSSLRGSQCSLAPTRQARLDGFLASQSVCKNNNIPPVSGYSNALPELRLLLNILYGSEVYALRQELSTDEASSRNLT